MRGARSWLLLGALAGVSCSTVRTGTCFFVSSSGLALTSLHVVNRSHRIHVIDSTGRKSRTEIIARDERLDLAMLQTYVLVAPDVLPIAIDDAVLGDHVVAIRALIADRRLIEEVMAGVIVEPRALGMEFLLGTSAAAEHGSSGGPLVNENGEIVGGMTKRRDAPSGEATRLSFAVKTSSTRKAFGMLPAGTNPPPLDRAGAIQRARRASCLVIAR